MKTFNVICLTISLVFTALAASCRLTQIEDPKTLIADSTLVFIGRVNSVERSSITTPLSYPTWEGVTFRWLTVDVTVLEPFKGVKRDEIVKTMMLTWDGSETARMMYSPPDRLEPDKGDIFLFCVGPTPIANTFAALTGPYDEDMSILTLYRSETNNYRRDFMTRAFHDKTRFANFTNIWNLIDQSGNILPAGVTKFRSVYAQEIETKPSTNLVYLRWRKDTNANGWSSDVPNTDPFSWKIRSLIASVISGSRHIVDSLPIWVVTTGVVIIGLFASIAIIFTIRIIRYSSWYCPKS